MEGAILNTLNSHNTKLGRGAQSEISSSLQPSVWEQRKKSAQGGVMHNIAELPLNTLPLPT